jgi:hypothetical protein
LIYGCPLKQAGEGGLQETAPSSEDATHYLSNMCPTAHTKIYGETERWAQDFQLDKTNEGQTLFMSYISHRNINCFILPSFIH